MRGSRRRSRGTWSTWVDNVSAGVRVPPETALDRRRVVTLGGGHGQAVLLSALTRLDLEVSAIVSVADDGGCSGELRRRAGMPPPGDLRRCLTALARRRRLAALYEERIPSPGSTSRSAGNLVLSLAYERLGSMQAAVDWAAAQLACAGRVIPVSEIPGTMQAYDAEGRVLSGESHIAAVANAPVVVAVHGSGEASRAASEAITGADYLVFGPGSFFTSVLAVVSTPGVAPACIASRGHSLLIANLAGEGRQTADWTLETYARVLRDHLTIGSLGDVPSIEVLAHGSELGSGASLDDGTPVRFATLAPAGASVHDPGLLAEALCQWFGFRKDSGNRAANHQEAETSAEESFRRDLAVALRQLR